MKAKVYKVSSFAKSKEGGNPAGVVLDADLFSVSQMKKIAAYVGFSETAFVMNSDEADFKVRFFTPTEEVDLCGHATIATFYTLAELGIIKTGSYKQETKAGILGIELLKNGSVMMNQRIPEFFEILDREEVASSLNIKTSDLIDELPVQIVSTGIRDIIIPIKNLMLLNHMNPNFDKIIDISRKYNVIGYHTFTLETITGANANCRNFAPLYDIPEESATGTSNGALGCYLYQHGVVNGNQVANLVMEQGYSMKKPSEIKVVLQLNRDEIVAVKVGGIAANIYWEEIELT